MSAKNTSGKKSDEHIEKRKSEIIGILLLALGLFSGFSLFTDTEGVIAEILSDFFLFITGVGSYLFPFLFFIWGIALLRWKNVEFSSKLAGFILTYISVIAFIHTFNFPDANINWDLITEAGGIIGSSISWVLVTLFGTIGSYIILSSLLLIGILLWFDILLFPFLKNLLGRIKGSTVKISSRLKIYCNRLFSYYKKEISDSGEVTLANEYYFNSEGNQKNYPITEDEEIESIADSENEFKQEIIELVNDSEQMADMEAESNVQAANDGSNNQQDDQKNENNLDSEDKNDQKYKLPSLSLLKSSGNKKIKLSNKSDLLQETLSSFGVEASVKEVSHGPKITRYEVEPDSGVKVKKIVNLADDIALALAAPDVRIEAPIPGKAAVGIEVPHDGKIFVRARDLFSSNEFQKSDNNLTLALGKGIDGKPIVGDLSAMPHLLIAGATGSGKSVCLNVLIASFLFKFKPQDLKMILVDPKKVELSNYKGLPHLFTPVVTDPKKASNVLKLVVEEMEERYELFSESNSRGIDSHNKKVSEDEKLPYIVVIIDELSDLMMVAANEVEDSICRLAQMSRAAGIHLIIATQRPSVDVITGLIKANIPSRVSFAVSSQTDSRTILDIGGAQKLLGNGDMLYSPVDNQKPQRIQGAFISNEEINNLVHFVKKQTDPEFEVELDDLNEVKISIDNEKDELYEKAVKLVVNYRASISMLQRKLRIGHSRAARMIDTMEEEGIVGPHAGSKPREVLISEEDLPEYIEGMDKDDIEEKNKDNNEGEDNNNEENSKEQKNIDQKDKNKKTAAENNNDIKKEKVK